MSNRAANCCRLFVRKVAVPIALVSSVSEGLTAIPGMADLCFWTYRLFSSADSDVRSSEDFVQKHPGVLGVILFVAVCSILTDYMLEGRNFVRNAFPEESDRSRELREVLIDFPDSLPQGN